MELNEFILSQSTQLAPLLQAQNGLTAAWIQHCKPSLETFARLLSPAATPFLEVMAQRSREITAARFGRVVRLYAPLYVSNECFNACTYCGFSVAHKFNRCTLSKEEVIREAEVLRDRGVRHLLLVSGEAPNKVSVDYLCEMADAVHDLMPSLSVEVSPFSKAEYQQLVAHGVEGLAVYQETYDRELYKSVHPRGRKADYDWRLATPSRGAEAGMRHISLGVLLGLSDDWRLDSLKLFAHIQWMLKKYWRSKYSVSLPRLCACEGGFQPGCIVSDKDLAQLIFAYRIACPDLGVNLSTREPAKLRDGLVQCGVTHMSSEAATDPGGYSAAEDDHEGKQFEITDTRKSHEIEAMLMAGGLEPVWKDWDASIL